jgi:hypothetical protein
MGAALSCGWHGIERGLNMDKTKLIKAFQAADAAWDAELVRRFGSEACNARYEKRGRGSFDDNLGRLFLARDKARMLAGF